MRGKEYVYVWADGIYIKSRLDGEKTCLLVMIGVGIDGKKELIAMESWAGKAPRAGGRFSWT